MNSILFRLINLIYLVIYIVVFNDKLIFTLFNFIYFIYKLCIPIKKIDNLIKSYLLFMNIS
jgi:hypothetical protein